MQSDFKNFDWDGLIKSLPIKKTEEDRAQRKKLWDAMDMNRNGYLSLAEFDKGVRDVLKLPKLFPQKKVLIRAYNASKDKIKGKSKYSKDYVEWLEFRYLLIYLRQFFEYYVMFCRVDLDDNFKIDLKEFKTALPNLEKWGVSIPPNPQSHLPFGCNSLCGSAVPFSIILKCNLLALKLSLCGLSP